MKLFSLFSDHAVLQRNLPIPVWGWTRPGVRIRASLAGCTVETISSPEGYFMLRFPPLPAGGPFEMFVESSGSGKKVVIRDLLIGEVWLASGQSNMFWQMENSDPDPEPRDISDLRIFSVERDAGIGRASDVTGSWEPACGKVIGSFSAVAYYFGRKLHEKLDVPVGIVSNSWGGSRIEAWLSREELMLHPSSRMELLDYERKSSQPEFWQERFGEFGTDGDVYVPMAQKFPDDPGNEGEALGWAEPELDDSDWMTISAPGYWASFNEPNNGSFWHRREVTIPREWNGRELLLSLGATDKHDVTYVNGVKVGATGSGLEAQYCDTPRDYIVPPELVASGQLLIAVRIFSFAYAGGFAGPGHLMRLRPSSDPAADGISLQGEWRARREHDLGLVVPPKLPHGPGNHNTPAILFNRMLSPMVPFAIRGAIWYQGESNVSNAAEYARLQIAMIDEWRRLWGQGTFPFGLVQLAAFREPAEFDAQSGISLLREAQLKTSRHPAVGMASTIDIGDAQDIHPRNKRDVGFRLAHWAMAEAYGAPGSSGGPRYLDYVIEGNSIRARFDNCGNGLVARDGELRTFFIAGEDRKFHPASARIENNTVVASCPQVPAPVALRYAWADNPRGCNLYNSDGLPASPFRTDTWPKPEQEPHES